MQAFLSTSSIMPKEGTAFLEGFDKSIDRKVYVKKCNGDKQIC
jgi:hypothetical protein